MSRYRNLLSTGIATPTTNLSSPGNKPEHLPLPNLQLSEPDGSPPGPPSPPCNDFLRRFVRKIVWQTSGMLCVA